MNSYYSLLKSNVRFSCEEGLFYQIDFPRNNPFEESYLSLREKEGRLYGDPVVRLLPEFYGSAQLATELKIRKQSARRLMRHLQQKNPGKILEIGCGNGWLIHYLQRHVSAEYLGVDINEPELKQAIRMSTNNTCSFLYGDIFSDSMNVLRADAIIVASAAQYFPDLKLFIQHLLMLLVPGGEIHIIDTAFYNNEEAEGARKRSENYFSEMLINRDKMNYYHHCIDALESFHYEVAYQPHNLFSKLKRKIISDSPFPWIIIRNN